jgi:hypothetical protein
MKVMVASALIAAARKSQQHQSSDPCGLAYYSVNLGSLSDNARKYYSDDDESKYQQCRRTGRVGTATLGCIDVGLDDMSTTPCLSAMM